MFVSLGSKARLAGKLFPFFQIKYLSRDVITLAFDPSTPTLHRSSDVFRASLLKPMSHLTIGIDSLVHGLYGSFFA